MNATDLCSLAGGEVWKSEVSVIPLSAPELLSICIRGGRGGARGWRRPGWYASSCRCMGIGLSVLCISKGVRDLLTGVDMVLCKSFFVQTRTRPSWPPVANIKLSSEEGFQAMQVKSPPDAIELMWRSNSPDSWSQMCISPAMLCSLQSSENQIW